MISFKVNSILSGILLIVVTILFSFQIVEMETSYDKIIVQRSVLLSILLYFLLVMLYYISIITEKPQSVSDHIAYAGGTYIPALLVLIVTLYL